MGLLDPADEYENVDDNQAEVYVDDEIQAEVYVDDDNQAEAYFDDESADLQEIIAYDSDSEMLPDTEANPRDVIPDPDGAYVQLNGHTKSIFCVDFHPTKNLIVTGSEDDKAIIWNLDSGSELFVCEGHSDSVTCAVFSPDGEFLATGDMGGVIKIWHIGFSPAGINNTNFTLNRSLSFSEVNILKWWHLPPSQGRLGILVLLIACIDGSFIAVLVSTSQQAIETPPRYMIGPPKALTGIVPVPSTASTNRPLFATIYCSGEFRVWDVRDARTVLQVTLPAPPPRPYMDEESIYGYLCISAPVHQTIDVVAIGGEGTIVLVPCKPPPLDGLEFTSKKIQLNSCTIIELDPAARGVESIEFSPTHPFFVYGTLGGEIGIYDISIMGMRHKWYYEDPEGKFVNPFGITCVKWSLSEPLIFYTATLGADVVAWSASSTVGSPLAIWRGHNTGVLDFALSPINPERPRETFLASVSDGHTAPVFTMDRLFTAMQQQHQGQQQPQQGQQEQQASSMELF